MNLMRLALSCVLLVGCASDAQDDPADGPVDIRREFPTPPEGAVVWETPDWIIPAFSERQFCYFDTYDGVDVGIHAQRNYQTQYGHHVTLFGTSAAQDEFPDGTAMDCTSADSLNMADMEPIIIGGTIEEDEDGILNEFVLPEGMAAILNQGQRVIIQSHYVNVTENDILVRDAAHLEVIPEAEVETWAAPFVNTITDFQIPANTMGYNVTFNCVAEASYTMLYLGGHLHEWGASFQTRLTRGDQTDVIYDVPEWDPVLRDAPMYIEYEPGEFVFQTGDIFTTSCTWNNDTDQPLEFPQEMCVTFGMIYPSKVPIICDPS